MIELYYICLLGSDFFLMIFYMENKLIVTRSGIDIVHFTYYYGSGHQIRKQLQIYDHLWYSH